MGIRRSGNRDQEISILAAEVPNLVFFPDKEQDRKYKVAVLTRGVEHFDTLVPNELTNKLAYSSDHYDFVAMITSTFAHASWEHLLGNLFFFFVFGSCVECVLGSFQFSLCFIVMAITTSVAFSFSVAGGSAIQTIGLSGVAMGMMAMLTALLPKANIWCFFWFFFWIRRFTLPVLAITAWFVCWNVFDLYFDHSSHINYMAHVSGAITGVALGICYRVFAPKKLEEAVVSA
jgi:membrane associated rhomboid family serine protease